MFSKTLPLTAILCVLLNSPMFAQITVGVFDMGKQTMTKVDNQDLMGSNLRFFDLKQSETCQTCIDACLNDSNCVAYTFTKPGFQAPFGRCYLKSSVPAATANNNCISGVKTYLKESSKTELPWIDQNLLKNYAWSPYEGPEMKGAIDLPGADYKSFFIPLGQEQLPFVCRKACLDDPKCNAWTYVEPGKQGTRAVCWLKTFGPATSNQDSVISGLRLKPLAKNVKKKQELDITNITSVKNELARFDTRWKVIMDSAVGSFNSRYYKFKTNEIIQYNQLLKKCGLQQKIPSWEPIPLPRPAFSMEVRNHTITAKIKDNPAILINLRDYSTPAALPNPFPYPGFLMDFNNGVVTATFKGKTIKTVPTNASSGLKLPNITGIHSITTDEIILADLKKNSADDVSKGLFTVLDCHYIIIYGKNLCKVSDTCGVRIEYDIQPYEDFSGKPPLHYAFDLIPYAGSWQQSWFDDFIIARVPPLPGPSDINKHTSAALTNKTICIWMGGKNSYLLKHEINIKPTSPGIAFIEYAPKDTPLYDNATFWIYGSGFGEYQLGKEIYILADNKRYDVTVVPEKWSQNMIQAIAPAFLLDIEINAQLVINNLESGRKSQELPIKIGPLMSYVWITGEKYANLQIQEKQDNAQIIPAPQYSKFKNVFAVSHYPNCEANYSGNDTEDWYFKDFPNDPKQGGVLMHQYFRYNDFFYYPLEAELDNSWEAWLSTVIRESIDMYSNPIGFFGRHLIQCLIISIFPGTGKYGQYLMKEPTVNDPSTAVHFNNTCWGPSNYYNIPNKYLISFQLYGPVKYFGQLEKNPADMQSLMSQIFDATKK